VYEPSSLFQPPIPDPNNIRDFVSYPTAGNERLHCTMKRAEDSPETGGPCYTLYLEYLGGLVPILKGRRISKLRPEFVIMDPKMDSKAGTQTFIRDYVCSSKLCFQRGLSRETTTYTALYQRRISQDNSS